MRKIICLPEELLPKRLANDTKYFSIYSNPNRKGVGFFGLALKDDIKKAGFRPPQNVWDFNTIAWAVTAADKSLSRATAADAWTREIDLTIHLCDPDVWKPVKPQLQQTLRFLTGDFWHLTFKDGGVNPPKTTKKQKKPFDFNCVCLLSGGVDSLVGAIDLVAEHHRPILVSQTLRHEAETQKRYAREIGFEGGHIQWGYNIGMPDQEHEGTTRGRSIIFFAFAALAASAIQSKLESPVKIYVPENGFISLNIPLNPGRIGSLSTKTTHPVYLEGIQAIWEAVDMKFELVTPYIFKTKGEVLAGCKNQSLLKNLVYQSVSCGRYRVYNKQHCGRCVPCMARRAAFLKMGIPDNTTGGYKFNNLAEPGRLDKPNDVIAMANACLTIRQFGLEYLLSGSLFFAAPHERENYAQVVSRGFTELEVLLRDHKVI